MFNDLELFQGHPGGLLVCNITHKCDVPGLSLAGDLYHSSCASPCLLSILLSNKGRNAQNNTKKVFKRGCNFVCQNGPDHLYFSKKLK